MPSLLLRWLEQLNEVTGRVLKKRLFTSDTHYHFVAKDGAFAFQLLYPVFEVVDHKLNPVPAAWRRHCTIGHGLASPSGTRLVNEQVKVAEGKVCKGRFHMLIGVKAKHFRIKSNSHIYIFDNVPEINSLVFFSWFFAVHIA